MQPHPDHQGRTDPGEFDNTVHQEDILTAMIGGDQG